MRKLLVTAAIIFTYNTIQAQTNSLKYDKIILNGLIYDGSGGKPFKGDVAINRDTIAAIGKLSRSQANEVIDVKGMAIAPGFINMLSQAQESLIIDGRSQSDIRQGVTLEVLGEGWSMGPLNAAMKNELASQGSTDEAKKIVWNTLGEYLSYLENRGVSCNVASFVGATTIRTYMLGEADRLATPVQLDSMRFLVRQAMEEGAMGLSSSLIYPPAFFASTDELIALAKEAATYDGMYISHIRNEANRLFEAVEELMTIAEKAHIRAEIYHLKAVGRANWDKMDSVIKRVERARRAGLTVTANMYPYIASATRLTTVFPPAFQDGGFGKLRERLQDTAVRRTLKKTMNTDAADWDNRYYSAGPDNILLQGFMQDSLQKYKGKTLTEAALMRHASPEETAIDLVVQDNSPVSVAYFIMKEEKSQNN